MVRKMVMAACGVMLAAGLVCAVNGKPAEEGPVEVPFPKWVFGHVVWYDESTTESVYGLVKDYMAHGIPVDGVIIDSPWETAYNTFEPDPERYPAMKEMIADLHRNDIRTIFWITPNVNLDDPEYQMALDKGYFVKGMEKVEWWKGPGGWLDYDNPEALAWWHKRMDKAIDLGIDGWKCDGTDPYVLLKGWQARKDYSRAYYSDFYDYTRERTGQKTVIMARPLEQIVSERTFGLMPKWNPLRKGIYLEYAPVDRSFMSWVGDQDPTLDGLKLAIRWIMDSAKANYLIIGSDIGGYREGGPDKTTLLRWAQFGALCPFMENGGGGEHRPWMFDDETLRVYRAFALLHRALEPYLFTEAVVAWRDGRSMIKVMDKGKDHFMLGRDILIAPIVEASGEIEVELPEGGNWVPLFGAGGSDAAACAVKGYSNLLQGGCSFTHVYPLHQYPVFVRAGAVIPFKLKYGRPLLGDEAREKIGDAEDALLLFPASKDMKVKGVVYEQGEEPMSYEGELQVKGGGFEVVVEDEEWPMIVPGEKFPLIPGEVEPAVWKE